MDDEPERPSIKPLPTGQRLAPRKTALLSSRKLIYISLLGDVLVAITKLGAAAFTGSSAMLSEAVHSVVDMGNSLLLLYGLHRAKEPADHLHPLGHGRELYFWSFVVAVIVFALGAGVALYEGAIHILDPEPIENAGVSYIVLGLSAVFDGLTWWIALRSFKGRTDYLHLFQAFFRSKDPPSFMVLFEDSAALIGLFIAFLGTYFSVALDMPVLDGVASILIGLVLAATAALLAWQTKALLMGEAADQTIVDSILKIAEEMPGVAHANGVITIHLGPRQIVVALSLEFADELKTPEIEAKIAKLEQRLRHQHPEVSSIFVKPQSSVGFKESLARRYGAPKAS